MIEHQAFVTSNHTPRRHILRPKRHCFLLVGVAPADVASMFRDEKWTVVIVTGREQPADKLGRLGLLDFPIVVSGPLLKEHAAIKAGYKVDVWVDDMPGVIQDCKIIQPSDDL